MTYLPDPDGPRWPSLAEIADGVRTGTLDPVLLTEQALQRAAEVAELNAVVHVDVEGARTAAAALAHDERRRSGPLAGVPILVKEIIEVDGLPFRCGSTLFADRLGQRDAAVLTRARAAGAIIIGLAHTHEFAFGSTGNSNRIGPARNPYDPTRMTGGSSSGSASAVATGIVPLAIGTDTTGSVRLPAALCGVVGAKPARGTISRDGVFPLSGSLDHVGVLTRTVADAERAVRALAEPTVPYGVVGPIDRPLRLGIPSNPEPLRCEPVILAAFAELLEALRRSGAEVVDVTLPDWARMVDAVRDTQNPEAAAIHLGSYPERAGEYQPDVAAKLRTAREVPAWRYVRAREEAAWAEAALTATLADLDGVLLPTSRTTAPPLQRNEVEVRDEMLGNTRPASLTGHPAISLPIPAESTLPVGVQVVAADNATMFATAARVEGVLRPAELGG